MATLLVITVLLPMLGAVVLFLNPGLDHRAARGLALATVLVTLIPTAILLSNFQTGQVDPQFAVTSTAEDGRTLYGYSWFGTPDVRLAFGLDGVSIGLFALTAFVMIVTLFASWESVQERAATHYALLLALESGLLGLFASLDVVLFYIFFEFTLIPLFFLIGLYGGPERRKASIKFFVYTLVGSLLTLVGVASLVVLNQQYGEGHHLTFSIPELTNSLRNLEWPAWSESHAWGSWDDVSPTLEGWDRIQDYWSRVLSFYTSPQVLIFLLLFAGFAIKVPLFPFHTWLPLAHVEAPTAGSIMLAGVLLKLGAYGLLRFNLGMTPLGAEALYPLLAFLSVAGILYGALAALAQTDIKRLVAYSSVSHMGFITLGLFSLNETAIEGAVIQMINHGLSTPALFACVGVIYERYHTRQMGELGGLWDRMPLFAFFFIAASMGSAALPGLNGFVGEFPILAGAFLKGPAFAIWACLGMILGAYYLLLMLQKVVFGPLREPGGHGQEHNHGHDHGHGHHDHGHAATAVPPLGWHEILGLGSLIVPIVLIGIYPKPIFDQIRPTTSHVVQGFTPQPKADAIPEMAGTPADTTTQPALAAQDRAR